MEHRKEIIKSIYRNIITNRNEVLSSKNIRNSLLMNNEFAYIDNGTGWDLYIAYVDNGTDWVIIS